LLLESAVQVHDEVIQASGKAANKVPVQRMIPKASSASSERADYDELSGKFNIEKSESTPTRLEDERQNTRITSPREGEGWGQKNVKKAGNGGGSPSQRTWTSWIMRPESRQREKKKKKKPHRRSSMFR